MHACKLLRHGAHSARSGGAAGSTAGGAGWKEPAPCRTNSSYRAAHARPARLHARRAVPTGLNAATLIGDYVTIEPHAVLRSCRVGPKVLVGARSVICEGAIVESETILAPGTVVPPARRIPSGELWGGNPAKFIRKLTGNEVGGGLELCVRVYEGGGACVCDCV